MWIPLQVLTRSSHNFSYASPWQYAIKHSDISEYSIWYSRVIQYDPPGIQQLIYPSKLAHAESTIDSHTHYLQTLPTYYSNIVLNFAIQYICQRLGFFFFSFLFKRNVATKISIVYQIFTWTSSKCAIHIYKIFTSSVCTQNYHFNSMSWFFQYYFPELNIKCPFNL